MKMPGQLVSTMSANSCESIMWHLDCRANGDHSFILRPKCDLALLKVWSFTSSTMPYTRRSTVQTEDVLLLARRAEPLKQHLAGLAETISANKQKRKKPVAKRNLSKD